MMPAAKHFDPVLGVDIHIIQPPGPVPPVPIPHPFVGFLIDPMDYVPIVGSTVLVNGIHRAQAGTAGKCLPPHIPIGGTFVKPPGNECEMFMGSATVEVDGDAFSYLALPALSCQCIGMPPPPRVKKKSKAKSLLLPTSVVLPIPAGPPVLVGGPPTISLMAMGMKLGMAGLGKAFKKLRKTKLAKRLKKGFKKAKQKAFKNMKPGFVKCKVLRAEPVDITTGEVVVDQQDFSIPGRIPLEFNRYYSSHSDYVGGCGYGWQTQADARLELDDDGVVSFYDGGPGAIFFDSLPESEPVMEPLDGGLLDRTADRMTVRVKTGLIYEFPKFEEGKRIVHVERIRDLCGNYLQFVRNAAGLKEIRESAGRSIEVISSEGRINEMKLRHPDYKDPHPLVRFDYSEAGDLVAVYDALNHAYRFHYEAHRLIQHTDRNGLSFYYEYDKSHPDRRCVHSWGDGGLYNYFFAYDDLIGETQVVDSLGNTSVIELNEQGRPIREIDPLGGEARFEYDTFGRATVATDAAGRRTEYIYDLRGNLISLVRPDGVTLETCFEDRTNKPIMMKDANGNAWHYEWNEFGLLNRMISPRKGEWLYIHDDRGDLATVRDPCHATTCFDYDVFGNLLSATDSKGLERRYIRDPLGLLLEETHSAGCRTRRQYDAKGRCVRTHYSIGSSVAFAYDGEDNLTEFINEKGGKTRFRYGGLGEVTERIRPDGSRVLYEYDTEEQLCRIINEKGQVFTIQRDSLGRVVRETDYWGMTSRYQYDASGNVVEFTDPCEQRIVLQYDCLGRLVKRVYGDGHEEHYAYDANGNLVLAENNTISVTRTYDEDGFLVEEKQGDFAIVNTYDLCGNRTKRSSTIGRPVAYCYDGNGNLTRVALGDETVATIEYDAADRPTTELLGQHLVRSRVFDQDGNVCEQEVRRNGERVLSRRYEYDPTGNLTQRHDSRKGRFGFAYNPLQQMRSYSSPDGDIEEILVNPASGLVSEDPEVTFTDGRRAATLADATYYYDAAGRLSRRKTQQGEAELHWSANDALTLVVNEQGEVVRFAYDALGRRIYKEFRGTTTRYYWDEDHLLADHRAEDEPREFIYYPDSFVPLASVNGRVLYYENDPVGLPHELLDSQGEIVWSAIYDGLGRVNRMEVDSEDNPLRFQGQYYDSEISLCYNRYRYFDPSSSSFISQDPLGFWPSTNLYRYAPNVWAWIDPLGLSCGKTRRQALREAKERAGIPRSQQPSRQWEVGNDPTRRGQKNYRYSDDPGSHGRYYEFETPHGTRVVADHTADPRAPGPHTHAGQPKGDPSRRGVDFKSERYQQVGGRHHIYYDE